MPFTEMEYREPTLEPSVYWEAVWEYLTKYLPKGETESQREKIDSIEDEMYEIYPMKYPDPFIGAYYIAKALKI